MRLVVPIRKPEQTPEGIFADKYAWLLRWAMHFSHNDRSAAEDLVQEAFVRMLLSWEKLHSLHDLEPLLYSYLRYAHLNGLRKGTSYVFQSLSTVDSDTIALSLRVSTSFDQIEVQNELRSILHYLLWRRDSAKFASIFLFRFFHGFYPEEIAAICVATRHSVDLSLRHARAEVKGYLADPQSVERSSRPRIPELQKPNVAVPVNEFIHELRQEMFNGSRDACPTLEEIERNYRAVFLRSLDCNFLAHLVTCEVCLEKATRICGAPPPSDRSMEDSLASASRSKQPRNTSSAEKATVARAITESKRRVRDIYEHYPTGLVIAINGDVFAVRDIGSRRSVLRVETHAIEKLELIEIFSEQRMLLLALPVLGNPPLASPQLRQAASFSADRTLTVLVEFTCNGVSIEAVYDDPHYAFEASSRQELEWTPEDSGEHGLLGILHPAAPSMIGERGPGQGRESTWREWASRLREMLGSWKPHFRPVACVSACLVAILAAAGWIQIQHGQQSRRFQSALERSVQAEQHPAAIIEHAALHRRVEIHAPGEVVARDLYSDLEGYRRARQHSMTLDEQALSAKLARAGVDWNDPLTAASFERWHDRLARRTDAVQTQTNLVVMTTTTPDSDVRLESLTVRESDLHPVARRVLLKDGESFEIAEVAYEIVPWSHVDPSWFEPQSSINLPRPILHRNEHDLPVPLTLTEGELDSASLGVLQALNELRAETERLEVKRTRQGVEVTGVVENADRKQQLAKRLRAIPHVLPEIFTYQELDARGAAQTEPGTLVALSVSSGDSQLDVHCRSLQIAHDECQRWSYRLLNSATLLMRDSRRLSELQTQFPADKSLSSDAKTLLANLVAGHIGHLNAAIWDQQQTLQALQLWPASATATESHSGDSLTSAAVSNQACIRELVYGRQEGARPATAIARDLAHSLQEVRSAISRVPANPADHTAISSGTPTPREY